MVRETLERWSNGKLNSMPSRARLEDVPSPGDYNPRRKNTGTGGHRPLNSEKCDVCDEESRRYWEQLTRSKLHSGRKLAP